MNKFLFWAPRIASLLFVGFLSVFAFDVFGEYQGWQTVLASFIHLIPSLALLVLVLVAWRYELAGAAAFLGLALLYVGIVGLHQHWS